VITYTKCNSQNDLEGILTLQKANLSRALSADEIQSQGFVTVDHTFDMLKSLNDLERHVIAKHNSKVVGYVLAMTKQSRFDIPVLIPMFDVFDLVSYKNKKISAYNYIIVGQVCVDKNYRGAGIFDNCYAAYRKFYDTAYEFAITEIAATNLRSLKAHKRIGFEEIYSYTASNKTEWIIVVWDWKK
jgi:L-amino acid N-acyltransferase YncA